MNCKICDKVFSGIECFKEHEASVKHKRKLLLHNSASSNSVDGLAFNTFSGSQNMNLTCFPCSMTFQTLPDFIEHSGSEDHARMILLKKNTEDKLMENINLNSGAIDSTQVKLVNDNPKTMPSWLPRCEKCDKNFSGPEPYQQHISSVAHKKKFNLLAASECQVELPSSTSGALFCEICNIPFCGPEPYQAHMRGKPHHKKLALSNNRMAENSKENTSLKLMGTIQCETCDKMFSGPICYEQHLQSDAHKKAVDQSHYVKNLSGKENSPINSGSELEHSNHLNGFVPPSPWYCEICDVNCSGVDPFRMHLAGKPHKKKEMRAGANSKHNELRNLFTNQTSSLGGFSQASGQEGCTENNGMKITANLKTGDLERDMKNYLYGDSWGANTITPSNLNLTVFAVGEEINFDKKAKIEIEAKDLDMVEVKDEEVEDMKIEH